MAPLQEQIKVSIKNHQLLLPGQRALVAVSGGVDSMVLIHLLARLAREASWKLTVAHLNHQLRGASSLADERLVCRTAREMSLPIVVRRINVRAYAKIHKLSLEMAARKVRHDFLARTAVRRKIGTIALAHHLDDQIELFFLRLFRGSGAQGLAGMNWISPSPSDSGLKLIRPLLGCPKVALIEYARKHNVRFRQDSTNASLDIQRNRIRHELLPLLETKYQPGLGRNVVRTMDILAAESQFVNAVAESWLFQNRNFQRGAATSHKNSRNGLLPGRTDHKLLFRELAGMPFGSLPVALQRRCIQLQLIELKVRPEYNLVEQLRCCPERPVEVAKVIPQGADSDLGQESERLSFKESPLRVARDGMGLVRVSPVKSVNFAKGQREIELKARGGKLNWEGIRIGWQVRNQAGNTRPRQLARKEIFDANIVGQRITIRHWQPGDRFQPIGMQKPVKLQDLFVNQKVPREQRRHLAVAATARGELFWVEGLRVSERFKLTKATIRRLHWAWQRL